MKCSGANKNASQSCTAECLELYILCLTGTGVCRVTYQAYSIRGGGALHEEGSSKFKGPLEIYSNNQLRPHVAACSDSTI